MKRIQIKLIAAVAVLSLACGLPTNIKAQQQTNTTTEAEMRFVFPIKGWAVFEEALRDYEIGADTAIKHGGKASAFARSKLSVSAARAIALRQSVPADRFRSQKIRLSGWIKGDQVEGWAGLWLRIDGDQG